MNTQEYLNKGYTVTSEGDTTITLTKKKSISLFEAVMVIVGFPMLFFFGVGLVLWLVAILNYIVRGDDSVTICKVDKVN